MEDCVDELLNSLSDYNKTEEDKEKTAGEAEENGTSEPNSGGGGGGDGGGGGLIEQIISHLPVAISGVLNTSAAAESSNENKGGDKPEAKKAEEPEGIVSSPRIALPVAHNGPDSEEATILISIVHD